MQFTALHDVRTSLESAVIKGLQKAKLEDTPETRQEILNQVIKELNTDLAKSDSVTEKLWLRHFRFEAENMLEELSR